MDMRFYWIKDRVKQGQFNVYWGPGYQNLADCEIYIHADEQPINRKGIRDSALQLPTPMLIPRVRPARKYSISPWEMIHLPREIMQ
jgi:hypothetical protein